MLVLKDRPPAIRTIEGWATSVLLEAGAIRECEEHGWMKDRTDPQARQRGPSRSPASIHRLPSRSRMRRRQSRVS